MQIQARLMADLVREINKEEIKRDWKENRIEKSSTYRDLQLVEFERILNHTGVLFVTTQLVIGTG